MYLINEEKIKSDVKSYFLVNSWESSSELIIVETIANYKIRTLQTHPIYCEVLCLVRSIH